MANLTQLLQSPTRNAVVADLSQAAEDAVSSLSGISGMAFKGALAAAKKTDSAVVSKGVNRLLPDLLNSLESYWQEFEGSEQSDFGTYLDGRSAEITESIMASADKSAEEITAPGLARAYKSLRGKASSILEPNVSTMGSILQRHMDAA
ncbi:hypothetical protein INS43_01845 [Corynebacterium aurimucosum]|uniref:DUF6918 family protein n=1 Tax=Corynebacterium aurimucosum TaxID=169292 RepID=UPI001879652C|nr:hypothetical protein [Corynebacterium aurimucosum]MBE7363933.1 hypothetical protein [Corynebacterium aurimucosum]